MLDKLFIKYLECFLRTTQRNRGEGCGRPNGMGHGDGVRGCLVISALAFCYFFTLSEVALFQTEIRPPPNTKALQVWDITVPSHLGYVTETRRSNGPSSSTITEKK